MEELRKRSRELARKKHTFEASQLAWLTVHGNLCLALRHPANRGPSRRWVLDFVKRLGKKLVEWEVITAKELEYAERTEIEEGSVDFI